MSTFEPELETSPVESLFDWPLFGLQDDARPALADAAARGVRAVMATLYGVVGAAPRGVGAQMVVVEDSVSGFLSGGCVEADLALHARNVLTGGLSERLVYGDGGPLDLRLPCGSRIDVLLEPIEPKDFAVARLLQLTEERRPSIWFTNGEDRLCLADDDPAEIPPSLRAVSAAARGAGPVCGSAESPFAVFRTYAPPVRLVAVGGDPIALAVVKLAAEMGVQTHLIRPHGPETCPLPGVQYHRSDVQSALLACQPDPWTAIAILTHDIEQEHLALTTALATHARYIGVLGSRRRMPERSARLKASGLADADIGRVRAPIGLPIGGKSPWEIAVSIIAEIINELDADRGC